MSSLARDCLLRDCFNGSRGREQLKANLVDQTGELHRGFNLRFGFVRQTNQR